MLFGSELSPWRAMTAFVPLIRWQARQVPNAAGASMTSAVSIARETSPLLLELRSAVVKG